MNQKKFGTKMPFNFKSKKSMAAYLSILITLLIFLFIFNLYKEQQEKYKDVVVDFCEKGCTYRFPKELKPEILSSSDKYPVVTLDFPFKGELISIWINRKIYLDYPENYIETDQDNTPYIIKTSELIDEFHNTKYQYFYTENQRKVILRNNTLTIATEQKIDNNINLLYFMPSELFSDSIETNEEINRKLDSMKVKKTNE